MKNNEYFDAAVNGAGERQGKAYFFMGNQYARYDFKTLCVDDGYPRLINQTFNFPEPFAQGIDAAVNGAGARTGKAYFFKGDQYFRYDFNTLSVDEGYPRSINPTFQFPREFAQGIDAAVNGTGARAGKAYFFKGDQYFRYDFKTLRVDEGYPRSINPTFQFPEEFAHGIDAALLGTGMCEGKAYFFKGNQYIRYDFNTLCVDKGYPKNASVFQSVINMDKFPYRTTTVAPAKGYYDPSGQILNPETASISMAQNQNYEWTATSHSTPGWLIRTEPITLPEGKYIAWLQIWHKNWTDKLGEICIKVGGAVHGKPKDIIGQHIGSTTFPEGEYQRVSMEFTLKNKTNDLSLEIYYSNKHYIWTGSTHITRLGDIKGEKQLRPIFAMGHRRNNLERLNSAFENEHANGVEIDITPVSNDGKNILGFRAFHRAQGIPSDDRLGWGTQLEDMKPFWARILYHFDNKNAVCIVLDLKDVIFKPEGKQSDNRKGKYPYIGTQANYATTLLNILKQNGLEKHLSRIIFSVPGSNVQEFGKTVRDAGFPGVIDGYFENDYPSDGEGYGRVQYVDQMEVYGADMLGVGIDSKVIISPMNKWMHWLMEMANQRDRDGKLKKVYFWTVNSETSIRKILDYGIDGIMSDYPEHIYKVVNSSPYNKMVRMATQNDSLKEVHGFEKIGYPVVP